MNFDFNAQELNAMSEDERKAVLRGPFSRWQMEQAARHIAPFWWVEPRQSRVLITTPGIRVHNGTAFFVRTPERLLCVTAGHVYRGFMDAKRDYPRLRCILGEGGVAFDPERSLISLGEKVDIATFEVPEVLLNRIGKQPLNAQDGIWPPLHPFTQQGGVLIGYPGDYRLWIDEHHINFGIYCAGAMIGVAGDNRITFPFDRTAWIDTLGNGLPPSGLNLGGISGGPVLILTEEDRDWSLNLGGVISEMPDSIHFETVVAVPAHFIDADGKVNERSAPIQQYVITKDKDRA